MGKNIKNKKIIVLLVLLGIFGAFSVVFALEVAWPNSPAGTPLNDTSNLTDLIKYLYEWGIAIGGLAVFIALVIAGFQYLTSMGDPGKMKEAKERITSAFLGLVLLLGSWLILNTINPGLTTVNIPLFDVPEANIPGTGEEKTFPAVLPCEKVEIIASGGTVTLRESGKCVNSWGDNIYKEEGGNFVISAHEVFSTQGYLNGRPVGKPGDQETCSGFIIFYAGQDCAGGEGVGSYSSPTNENVFVSQDAHSVRLWQ